MACGDYQCGGCGNSGIGASYDCNGNQAYSAGNDAYTPLEDEENKRRF